MDEESYQIRALDLSIEEVRSTYRCELCNYETDYVQNLNRHKRNRHPPEVSDSGVPLT